MIGERSAEDQVGVISGRGRIGFPSLYQACLKAAELEREFDMLTSKFASVAGLIGAAVLAAAIGPGATSAFAASPDDQATIRVSVDDLNMTSEAGARVALRRIQHAADEICGGDVTDRSLGEQMQVRQCARAAVERAVASINLPALTAVSGGRHVATTMASADR
ncbi:MAG TPA: UrcA family protein [Caulobacteraceae bacterium]|nr:UrcA family protein [Caulobacteraceae bacterium]